ncbi:Glycosyltransferase 2-like domain-containing protein [Plasmodiophora brassicae]
MAHWLSITTAAIVGDHAWYFLPVAVVAFYRVLFYLVDTIWSILYEPVVPRTDGTTFFTGDVTVVCVVDDDDVVDTVDFPIVVRSWASNAPQRVIVAVGESHPRAAFVKDTVERLVPDRCHVLMTDASQRHTAVTLACNLVCTPIVALVSHGALWGHAFVSWSLAPFDNPRVGVVSPSVDLWPERQQRLSLREVVVDMRLAMHNRSAAASNELSGAVAALAPAILLRSALVQDSVFQYAWQRSTTSFPAFLWRWTMERHWDFAFQRSTQAACSIRCPRAWARILDPVPKPSAGTRMATLLTGASVWRRHPVLALMDMVSWFDPILVCYALGLVGTLAVVNGPGWPVAEALGALAIWEVAGSLAHMWSAWSLHPGDLIYLPLFVGVSWASTANRAVQTVIRVVSGPHASGHKNTTAGPIALERVVEVSAQLSGEVSTTEVVEDVSRGSTIETGSHLASPAFPAVPLPKTTGAGLCDGPPGAAVSARALVDVPESATAA